MASKPTFINALRMWLGLIGIMGVGNTIQCFVSQTYLFDRLYTVDSNNVNGLSARIFGVWTLLSAVLRFLCAFNITNKIVYHATLFSFILAQVHFLSEVFLYKTAVITSAGIIAPLIITTVTITSMTIGYYVIDEKDPRSRLVDENEEILSGKGRKKFR